MVEHIVLVKFKPEVSEAEKEELRQMMLAMQGRIPGIVELSAGHSFTNRHQGYTLGLVVRFTDRAALEAYGPHPVHAPVKARVQQLAEDVVVVDYEH